MPRVLWGLPENIAADIRLVGQINGHDTITVELIEADETPLAKQADGGCIPVLSPRPRMLRSVLLLLLPCGWR